jgi:Ca2+-binding RTX toxin-like protein
MSTLNELKAKHPEPFDSLLGQSITHGVFSFSTNYPNQVGDSFSSDRISDGIQIVVGGWGNDSITIREGDGDIIVFSGPGLDSLYLPDIVAGSDWNIGYWRTDTVSATGIFGIEKAAARGMLFYNEALDQTIATGHGFNNIYLGSGAVIVNEQLSDLQRMQLESLDAYMGFLNVQKLIEEDFLPVGTSDNDIIKLVRFLGGAPQNFLDRNLGEAVVLEEATVYVGTDIDDFLYSEVGGHDIFMGLGLDFVDLRGTTAPNVVNGGNQGDTILGGDGGDVLRGGKGLDSIVGGAGDDTIYSGLGQDTLTGGGGADIFVLRGFDPNFQNALLAPTVTDFQAGLDKIAMQGVSDAEIATALAGQTQVSGGVQFTIAGATVTVQGVSSLAASDIGTAAFFGV